MRIIDGRPPMFEEILAAFPDAARPGVIFCWGEKIFAPGQRTLPAELVAHERVHCEQQWRGIEAWWRTYIADPEFRLREELPAHVAEFKSLCEQHRAKWVSERNMRRTFAAAIARKLAAPLYGNLISIESAKTALLDA
jgi:hypothetical protein